MADLTVRVDLKGFERLTRKELEKNFAKAGVYFASKMRGNLNTAQPYTRGKHFHGKNPSGPGEFPHKLTGQLQKSVTWTLDRPKLVLLVGSNLTGYPSFLQKGTKFMRPRPWLTLAWDKEKAAVGRLLAGGR